ncbi:MAG: M28 family peptidase [Muribaculaceae bacterium]|nr:M28 family peptidase [Muribaculaceae bacterium]
MKKFIWIALVGLCLLSCGANSGKVRENLNFLAESESAAAGDVMTNAPLGDFNADSAYSYLAKQVAFGPRVPNTVAHIQTGDWLSSELKRHGARVIEQKMQLKAFDGTILDSRNIFAQYNPDCKDRILLLAHWDSRPWADKDPDPAKRSLPVDGANDGASGVAVLLEIGRQLAVNPTNKGIDILFVDAEDWGTDGDEDSWALGTQYFVEHPVVENYAPQQAILLDMVGGDGAIFCREYFSERSAPHVSEQLWRIAHQLGYEQMFLNRMGTAVMDDHVQLIKAGIPAIDIIEYHPGEATGFNSRWHTTSDNLDGISKTTLKAVGSTVLNYLYNF